MIKQATGLSNLQLTIMFFKPLREQYYGNALPMKEMRFRFVQTIKQLSYSFFINSLYPAAVRLGLWFPKGFV